MEPFQVFYGLNQGVNILKAQYIKSINADILPKSAKNISVLVPNIILMCFCSRATQTVEDSIRRMNKTTVCRMVSILKCW